MTVTYSGCSDVGRKRSQNQDNFLLVPEKGLFVVADGMGGHRGGEIASQLSVETIAASLNYPLQEDTPFDALEHALLQANDVIFSKSANEVALQGMGTTTTALFIPKTLKEKKVFLAHVGDSRSYLIRPSRIWQITQDHSLVYEKLSAGIITREQLKTDKMKHVLTRSVGVEENIEIDLYEFDALPGDTFLICSDGLSGMLSDLEIRDIISENVKNLEIAAKKLIDQANDKGGDDNVTAVLVHLSST